MRTIAAVLLALALPAHASPAPGGYVGAAACGACHPAALATWQASAHARSAAALTPAERQRRRCQACHATGDVPAAPAVALAVECEACHGAGEAYAVADVMRDPALARALGLRSLEGPARAALCVGCHDADSSFTPFDAEAAWRQIAH